LDLKLGFIVGGPGDGAREGTAVGKGVGTPGSKVGLAVGAKVGMEGAIVGEGDGGAAGSARMKSDVIDTLIFLDAHPALIVMGPALVEET